MTFEFTVEIIPCSLSGYCFEEGYRLSNNTILLPSERNAYGNYYGGVAIGGIFLRTGTTYRPIYNDQRQLYAFEKINNTNSSSGLVFSRSVA